MHARFARWFAWLLPALMLAAQAAALPIKVRTRATRGGITGIHPRIRGTTHGPTTGSAHHGTGGNTGTNVGGRFAAGRHGGTGTGTPSATHGGGTGSGPTSTVTQRHQATHGDGTPLTPADVSQATLGREQATRFRSEGGGHGTGDGTVQGTRQGLFGVPDGTGGTTGLRNGLDGSGTVVATRRLTPEGIVVVRNQPGAHLSRGGAFQQAKRVAGIPANAQPRRVFSERLTDQARGTDLARQSRVYEFDGPNGTTIQIREHSYGHAQDMAGPHFNVDVFDRGGRKINDEFLPTGADRHFYFAR